MKKADIVIIIIVLIIGVAGAVYMNMRQFGGGSTASIYVDGHLYQQVSLEVDQDITVDNDYGHNVIRVENGQVYMLASDCKNQLCLQMAPIDSAAANIVCLPNHLHVEIDSSEEVEIDALSN